MGGEDVVDDDEVASMNPMKHGYTNDTVGDGAVVEKRYVGPDADVRRAREYAVLKELQGRLPVPPVLGLTDDTVRLGFVEGVPGQELLDAGDAQAVLASCGEVLGRIHATQVASLPGGETLVHGDFGPNNLLLDPVSFAVTAVVDWEFVHYGDPVEDLAWCEWIVRMHHPEQVDSLELFFGAYPGEVPEWSVRQAEMLRRCQELRVFCDREELDGPGSVLWQHRSATTASWTE
jgi:aminoglycoside phosphotransferase (APT) family kinase protein